ncbi:geranylgeranylglyceryl/heptaprenylglyceryl phosphate synthase [Candidatus Micrarchaeota archaeon]|nr:geranylgeranylglyceryl/heptaprenylglyceryl phosphate synthase [Candidatus Micrarchaeota archaeon]
MKLGKTEKYITDELAKKGALLFSLIDPDDHSEDNAVNTAKNASDAGTDIILIGGSTLSSQDKLDQVAKRIKESVDVPVVLFPGNVSWLTRYADATYFMSLLNSKNPYWISGAQAKGAPIIKKIGMEPIPVAYLVVEPGGTVGKVGEVDLIKRNDPVRAASLALAAELMGFHFVITDTGSNPKEGHVPLEMIAAVKSAISIPYIVAGGIKTADQAKSVVKAGADIIQVGTAFEKDGSTKKIKDMVAAVREGVKVRKK